MLFDNFASCHRPCKHVPDGPIRTALLVCGDCDKTSQFHIGVDLMIRGLDAYLQTLQEDTAAAPR